MAISYEPLVMATKSQEVANLHVNQNQKMNSAPETMLNHFQETNVQNMTRTTETANKDGSSLHQDAKDKGGNEYYRQQEEKRREEEQKKKNDEMKKLLGCSFNITI